MALNPPGGVVQAMPGSPHRDRQLLATKLFVPRPPPGFVPRPRLVERLDAGFSGGLTLVCAPAGYGKTSLVSEWARRRAVAWLSLDPGDNDPTRFWRHMLAALDGVHPGTAERVEPALGPPLPPSMEGPLTLLINELTTDTEAAEIVLALDDYQVIDSPSIHESLSFLIEHRPPRLHLVVLSRVDPPLSMARVRAAGQLAELRAEDLRFRVDEAAGLLRSALQLALPDAFVAALAARTEGWAAGLRLAALSLVGRPDAAEFVEAFSGSHRYVLDYLSEEVLDRQSEQIRRFLLETSILDQLSGELCDAVTGRTDGQRMLEAIDRANLFVVPLDEVREWWRYHQLFADLLRARLHHESPERVQQLHRNAASWYERNGLAESAIAHALAADDAVWAAHLIERQIDATRSSYAFLLSNEEVTMERWLAALPAQLLAARPRLLLAQAELAMSRGDIEAVERALDAAQRAFDTGSDDVYQPSVGDTASLVANVPAAVAFWRASVAELRGDLKGAVAFDRRALAELGDSESVLAAAARLHLRTAELADGDLGDADGDVRSSIAAFRAAGQVHLVMRGIEILGYIQRARGCLEAALETYRWGLEIALACGRVAPPFTGIAHAGMAEIAYQRGQLDIAFEHATEATTLCSSLVYRRPFAAALATLARVQRAKGDTAAAMDTLARDPRVAPSRGVTGLLNPIPSLRARLMLATGDVAAARRWATDRGLGPEDELTYPREPEYLALARILLAEDHAEQAVGLLGRLRSLAQSQGRVGSLVEIDALRAIALAAAGQAASALATLSEVLPLAQPEGYIRVFVDEGTEMRELLMRLVAAQRDDKVWAQRVPLGYLGQLMRAFEAEGGMSDKPIGRHEGGVPGIVDPLSEREIEVLRLLAAGKSNQEIAEELFVALDTVKKHVSHILAKLGATNRTEATARARALGLLSS
jgi:LuxR family transcriptional regulator, maltose regulon positive regulatory protein